MLTLGAKQLVYDTRPSYHLAISTRILKSLHCVGISLVMIQPLLRRLDSIPIKTKLILWIWIGHLVEPIIPPKLPAFPYILDRHHTFLLHTLRHLCDLRPHSKDVLSSHQCELFFSCAAVQNSFQQAREGRAVLKARNDRCDTYDGVSGWKGKNIDITYRQNLTQDQRAPTRCGSQCRTNGPEAYP